jgi:hypothetical protein
MQRFRAVSSPSLQEIPDALQEISRYFCLFLAVNASDLSSESVQTAARKLVEAGAVYVCVWGPDCERVHDLFDQASPVEESPTQNDVVMTTWHQKESLEEALWFFVNCAVPTESFVSECQNWIAVSIGNDNWYREIVTALPTSTE